MCVDESNNKNEIQCVDFEYCNKNIVYLKINKKMLDDSNKFECAQSDNERFSNILYSSLKSKSSHDHNLNFLTFINNDMETKNNILYSAKIPVNFNIQNLRLPSDMIYCFPNSDKNSRSNDFALYLVCVILLLFTVVCILIITAIYYYNRLLIESKQVIF